MIIQQDTREKVGKKDHILNYFKSQGIEVKREVMNVGDYTLVGNDSVCIDTKQDVLELCMNMTKDHTRFRNECIRAQKKGIQLIILVEEELPDHNLAKWQSPVWKNTTSKHKKGEKISNIDPVSLKKALVTMQERYGVKFFFCNKQNTGRIIVEILKQQENNAKDRN